MGRRFCVDLPKKSPFVITKKDWTSGAYTWDWHFEENEYLTKVQTLKEFEKDVGIFVQNRGAAHHVFFVLSADIPNSVPINPLLLYLYRGLFIRMLKASKIIQDLAIEGNYLEAKALLRMNFEKAVNIRYFSHHPEHLDEYYECKKSNKRSHKFTVKTMVDHLKGDYKDYSYLSYFVHPNTHNYDVTAFTEGDEDWMWIRSYNSFEKDEFMWIMCLNNNIIIEELGTIIGYLMYQLPDDKKKEYKDILDEAKTLKLVELRKQSQSSTENQLE